MSTTSNEDIALGYSKVRQARVYTSDMRLHICTQVTRTLSASLRLHI
eukprot:SAG11_NODE_9068_length_947_cov_1.678066_1_plen_46_part_10